MIITVINNHHIELINVQVGCAYVCLCVQSLHCIRNRKLMLKTLFFVRCKCYSFVYFFLQPFSYTYFSFARSLSHSFFCQYFPCHTCVAHVLESYLITHTAAHHRLSLSSSSSFFSFFVRAYVWCLCFLFLFSSCRFCCCSSSHLNV